MTTPNDGWYPDPQDPSQYRFWDGSAWGEQTRPRTPFTEAGWYTHPDTGLYTFYDGGRWQDIPPPPREPSGRAAPDTGASPSPAGRIAGTAALASPNLHVKQATDSPRRWLTLGVVVLAAVLLLFGFSAAFRTARVGPTTSANPPATPSSKWTIQPIPGPSANSASSTNPNELKFLKDMSALRATSEGAALLFYDTDSQILGRGINWCARLRLGNTPNAIAQSDGHDDPDLIRATLEGVRYATRDLCPR